MASEVFGEADVILRGRLDQFQRDLDQAELLVVDQQQRIQRVQQETAQSARAANEEGDRGAGMLATLGAVFGAWRLAGLAVRGAWAAIMLVPAAALAAKAALVGLAVGGAAIALSIFGMLADAVDRATRALVDANEAARNLDGTTGRVRELAQALERIPIVGGAVGTAFRLMSRDAEVVDEALLGLIGRVEDGQVKIGGFRRFLAGGVGLGFMIREIDRTNEAMAQMNAVLAARGAVGEFTGPQSRRLDDAELDAQRANELEGVMGIQRVAIENRIRHEDAMRAFNDERDALRANTNEMMRQVDELEKKSAMLARIARAAIQTDVASQEQTINARQASASAELTEQAQKRADAAREEEAAAKAIADAETNRLRTMAEIAELRARGMSMAADMAEIESRRDDSIAGAGGNSEQIAAIERYYDAVAALREQRNQQEIAAEEEKIDKRISLLDEEIARQREKQEAESKRFLAEEAQRQSDLADLRSQGRQALLRIAGRDDDAEDEALQNRFRQQIEAARRAGDVEKANLLERLRDVEQQDLDRRQRERAVGRGSEGRSRQIDTARDFIGGVPTDPKSEEKEMVREQKKTNEQLRRLTTGARAA